MSLIATPEGLPSGPRAACQAAFRGEKEKAAVGRGVGGRAGGGGGGGRSRAVVDRGAPGEGQEALGGTAQSIVVYSSVQCKRMTRGGGGGGECVCLGTVWQLEVGGEGNGREYSYSNGNIVMVIW